MEKCGFEERPYPESYNAFHEGLRMLEESLRNTEDSEAIIDGLLRGAAGFYGAKRASVVEADWVRGRSGEPERHASESGDGVVPALEEGSRP